MPLTASPLPFTTNMDGLQAGPGPGSTITRAKGRTIKQLRPLACERGVLIRADGSASWSQDGSSILAAVYGPRQANARKEDAEKAVIEVVFKPRAGLAGHKERDLETSIRQAVEGVVPLGLHPRTSISITLQVLQEDGALLSCALNATCAALLDAGIPMTSMYASVTCGLEPDGTILVDPDQSEEEVASSIVCLAFPFHYDVSSSDGAATQVLGDALLVSHTLGSLSMDQYLDVFDVCREGCGQIAEFSRVYLAKGLS